MKVRYMIEDIIKFIGILLVFFLGVIAGIDWERRKKWK